MLVDQAILFSYCEITYSRCINSLVYLMCMHSNYSMVHKFNYHESEANGRAHQAVHLVLLLHMLAMSVPFEADFVQLLLY